MTAFRLYRRWCRIKDKAAFVTLLVVLPLAYAAVQSHDDVAQRRAAVEARR